MVFGHILVRNNISDSSYHSSFVTLPSPKFLENNRYFKTKRSLLDLTCLSGTGKCSYIWEPQMYFTFINWFFICTELHWPTLTYQDKEFIGNAISPANQHLESIVIIKGVMGKMASIQMISRIYSRKYA